MTNYRLNPSAFQEHLLNAEWMVAEMRDRAEKGAEFARSIAPVDETGPHPGQYRDSIETDAGSHGGIHHDRAYGIVRATAPESVYVEFGTERADGQHVIGKALDVIGG